MCSVLLAVTSRLIVILFVTECNEFADGESVNPIRGAGFQQICEVTGNGVNCDGGMGGRLG